MLVHIPQLDALLEPYAATMGRDAAGYRNHAYRVVNLSWSLRRGDEAAFERLVIAAAFHDLGLWTAGSLDYLGPSRALARAQLQAAGLEDRQDEIDRMIENHHLVRAYAPNLNDPVESFRRADWADLSGGVLSLGLDRELLRCVRISFPSLGFHCGLARRVLRRVLTNPRNPLPMLRF